MSPRLVPVRAFVTDESGAALAEYGLLVALIAAVCIVVVSSVGGKVSKAFASLDGDMP